MTERIDIIERGSGTPLVLVPGIQGRWEYSRGLVDALARTHRVLTFSLGDERGPLDAGVPRIERCAAQVQQVMDQAGVAHASIVGVSFGGLVALRFAATRPARTDALVMVSAPGPEWHLRPRHDMYARVPWLFGPLFLLESPFRLRAEVMTALPAWRDRFRYLREQARTARSARVSLARMAGRARLIGAYDRVADASRVQAPTLVLQGDERLDHVTGWGGTAEYARLIPGARLACLADTGHIGSVTRADDCAALVTDFLSHRNGTRRDSAA